MIKNIISGGHPGVEKAALDAALKLGIPYSGWDYKGRLTEDRYAPDKYNVKESADRSFENRIAKNVLEAAGTVIITHGKLTIGLKMVEKTATKHNRACLHIDLNESNVNLAAAIIRAWIMKKEIEVVYFTGQEAIKGCDIYSEVIGIIEGIHRMDTAERDT
jgi:hypothetical protein